MSRISEALRLPGRLPTKRRGYDDARGTVDKDNGFTILELMVALAVLMIMSLAVLTLLLSAMRVQSMARARTIAAQVAERTLEEARSWEIDNFQLIIDVYGGRYTPEPVTEGPFTFYRVIDVSWEEVSGTSNPAPADYLRVGVEVTWNDMGSSPPVRMTTYVTGPPCEANAGYIDVRVTDHLSNPVPNVQLDLYTNLGMSEGQGYTSSEGKYIFPCVFSGSYEITGTLSGYIAKDRRDRVVVGNITVQPRLVTLVEFQMARPATLIAHLTNAATGQELTGTGAISLTKTDFGPLVVSDTSPITVTNLWPDTYSLVGSVYDCSGMGGFMSATVGDLQVFLDSGINDVTLALRPGPQVTLEVTVLGNNQQPVQGAGVRAVDACGTLNLMPVTDSSGTSQRSGIRPGPYVVYVTPPGPYRPTSAQVIASSDPTRLTVAVTP